MPKARKKLRQTQDDRLGVISTNLRSIRKRRGFTQKELGEKIGMTREAVAAYEFIVFLLFYFAELPGTWPNTAHEV